MKRGDVLHTIEEQLKLHEDYRRYPYEDSTGHTTVGIGRNLNDKGITPTEAMILLKNDLRPIKRELANHEWYTKLSEVRRKVVLDMAFNLGIGGLFEFEKMIHAIKKDDYTQAALEMLDSLWADQVGKRAERLARMMKTNIDYKE